MLGRPRGFISEKKGRTYEELYGKEKAGKMKRLMSKPKRDSSQMGKYKRTQEFKDELSKNRKGVTYVEKYGEDRAKEISKMHSLKMRELHKKKIFGYKRGELIGEKNYFYGKKHTQEFANRQRINMQKHILTVGGIPQLGKNEKEILDQLEENIGLKIIRQYPVEGFFVDGYIPERNIVFEVDERPKTKSKDIKREEFIKNQLRCEIVRIPDYG